MKRHVRVALLCLVVCVVVRPSAFAADKWLSVRSKNFLMVGNASESEIRRAGRTLEEFRSTLAMMFPKMEQSSSVPTTIIVFKNDESFKPYKPVHEGQPSNALAFFQPGEDTNYIALTGPASSSPNIVLHEYLHALTRENLTGLPLWASEGLAEVYSTFEISGRQNEFTLGRAPERHITTLNDTPLIPLKTLFAVEQGSPYYNEQSRQGVFYAESWAVVHYLILGTDGKRRAQFTQFLTSLAKGEPVEDSFADAFQTDYGTLEGEVREYVRKRSSWPALKVTSKDSLQVDVRSINTATLSEAESEFYLGDLLLHMNRLAEAEPHLSNALSKTPGLIPAQASLAVLRVRQKKYDEAVTLLKKAVEADPKNHIVSFYYAYALERVDDDSATAAAGAVGTAGERYETMRSYARKSVELSPRFVEGYGLLARININAGENLDEAETVLKKALSIAPGRDDIHMLLAQSYLRANRMADARSVLSNLERITSDPEVRRRATTLLDQTEQAFTFTEITPGIEKEAVKDTPAEIRSPEPPLPPLPTRKEAVLEALTPIGPTVEGEKLTGLLILLECGDGLTMRIRTDRATVELHSAQPDKIQFLSYTSDVTDNIKCGPRTPGTPVAVTYHPVPGGAGDPVVVEFLDKK